ncbi:hypothetical protein ACO1PK_09055 [Alishewanella sp. d11]|uniref:hypothetical protein n=1 Tax=Alishewanella sp. d11 TaxID=3414030 RepID=UPI003BF913F8
MFDKLIESIFRPTTLKLPIALLLAFGPLFSASMFALSAEVKTWVIFVSLGSIFYLVCTVGYWVRKILTGDEKYRSDLFATLAMIVVMVILSFVTFFSPLRGYVISDKIEHWGQMGDFFGGMFNPLLAFSSFIALLYTIRIQSEELKLTREEFAKSAEAQQKLVKETENQRLQMREQIQHQQLQDDCRLCIQPIRDKINLIRDLLFDIETTVIPEQSLHDLLNRALSDERTKVSHDYAGTHDGQSNIFDKSLPEIQLSNVAKRLQVYLSRRPPHFFIGKVKRIASELEIADYLMGQLVKLKATGTTLDTLHAELGMPAALCEILDGFQGFDAPRWVTIVSDFYLDAKKIKK